MLPYSTVEVAKLEVIKPDGNVVTVDMAANSKESIDDSQMAENIYDPDIAGAAGQHSAIWKSATWFTLISRADDCAFDHAR